MSNGKKSSGTPQTMRNLFGIIMILVYVGVGILFFIGYFPWFSGSWEWARWTIGGLLVAYGIFRAYRQFSGLDDPYGSNNE
ncbi:MAG: hypothetical protein HDS11_04855 [Bacteroides sp.]|nr:hypothetical protein [Bacteroides sp.]